MFPRQHVTLLSRWFSDSSQAQLQSLGVSGGFSGAVIYRVAMPDRDLCLRRWPQAHPTISGLQRIHGFLQHLGDAGCEFVPVPLRTRAGDTYFLNEDHLWELTPWMSGEANYLSAPNIKKLTQAMHALAQVHLAAQSYRCEGFCPRLAPSPGLHQRATVLNSLQIGELEQLWQAARAAEESDLREVAFELLEGIVGSLNPVHLNLQQIVQTPLPLQWCLRDVRHDHLLFTDEIVTGLIDFGAADVDSVSCDLARLLSSMANDSQETWQAGIQAYSEVRPLSDNERRAIASFDEAGAICSAANWVRWLFIEGRSFPQVHALHAQLVWLRDRLSAIAERMSASKSPMNWKPSPHSTGSPRKLETPWMHT